MAACPTRAAGFSPAAKRFRWVWRCRVKRRKPLVVLGYGIAAVAKFGFPLATGAGGKRGPMDPRQFLGDADFAHAILRGMFDPRAAKHLPAEPTSIDPFADIIARRLRVPFAATSVTPILISLIWYFVGCQAL